MYFSSEDLSGVMHAVHAELSIKSRAEKKRSKIKQTSNLNCVQLHVLFIDSMPSPARLDSAATSLSYILVITRKGGHCRL